MSITRWAEQFDRRHRFGIPVLPITRKVAPMPPSIVQLPARSGSMKFSEEDVTAVIGFLADLKPGQAVQLTDDADDSENTARRRAEIMKGQIEERHNPQTAPLRAGFKLRGHVITAGEPTEKRAAGKNYKVYPENWGAVSLVPDNAPAESGGETPPADDNPPTTTPPADDAAAQTGRSRRGAAA